MVEGRATRQLKWFGVCGVVVTSVAFLATSAYCAAEVLVGPTPQNEAAHPHDGSGQHHGGQLPTPGSDDAAFCCVTIQAILASKFDVQGGSVIAQLFLSLTDSSLWSDAVSGQFRLASGLRPPTREPTPTTPFYLTTFANHAPPSLHA